MYEYSKPRRSRYLAQVASLALMASFLAGCSSDVSRFMGNTANQRSIISGQQGGPANDTYRDSDVTGSVPTGTVTRSSLPPAPAYSGPRYTPPTYTAPSYTPPKVEAPNYTPPRVEAPTYSAPSYIPPKVEAPSYTPPRVAAPTYTAPSYTPPQVSAPTARLPQVSATAPNYTAPRVEAALPPTPQAEPAITNTVRTPVRQVGPSYPPAPAPSAAAGASAPGPVRSGWSTAGGTAVTLRQGENIDTLALRYGVPRDALMRANNISDPYSLQPGQQVMIPTYVSASAAAQANAAQQAAAPAPAPAVPPAPVAAAAPAPAPMTPKPAAALPAASAPAQPATRPLAAAPAAPAPAPAKVAGATHTVGKGESLARIGHLYGVSERQIMTANGLSSSYLRAGQKLVIPGATEAQVRTAMVAQARSSSADATVTGSTGPAATQPAAAKPVAVKTVTIAPASPAAPARAVAAAQPAAVAPVKVETVKTAPAAPVAPAQSAASGGDANPTLAWPVRGKVVRDFGQKPNGERSEGIAIAVPEGTPVKSAADGEVIYAGSELKGYGNLVLVRHANGYVTAYGYNSDILVKRGDKVRAGQPVAKSGATGGVKEPQLHFEVRKGQRPVDPKALLASN